MACCQNTKQTRPRIWVMYQNKCVATECRLGFGDYHYHCECDQTLTLPPHITTTSLNGRTEIAWKHYLWRHLVFAQKCNGLFFKNHLSRSGADRRLTIGEANSTDQGWTFYQENWDAINGDIVDILKSFSTLKGAHKSGYKFCILNKTCYVRFKSK